MAEIRASRMVGAFCNDGELMPPRIGAGGNAGITGT
jgi:hypothetical protein